MLKKLIIAGITLLSIQAAEASMPDTIKGIPYKIHDGDTFRIKNEGVEYRVRLHGFDAFEIKQRCGSIPCGKIALSTLEGLINGQVLVCHKVGISYDRMVADCIREDGLDISESMILSGWGLVDERYTNSKPHNKRYPLDQKLLKAGQIAKETKAGVYQYDINLCPTWYFRKKECF